MTAHFELVVIGGGPAGMAAALEAAARGLSTLLIDDAHEAGGQIFRAPPPAMHDAANREHRQGALLRARLALSDVMCAFSHRVWLVELGFVVHALGPDGPATWTADTLILATGALERTIPIPGWTLPGVTGLAAATLLLKSQCILPGHRVVVAGSGPMLPLVAVGIVKAGGIVAAVIDSAPRAAWLRQLPFLASHPALLARGILWLATLASHGVPLLSGHALASIEGTAEVESVSVVKHGRIGKGRHDAVSREIACDAVCYGFGLLPGTEITRLLGAVHEYDALRGGWCVRTDDTGMTSIPRLFAAGDGAAVLGVSAALRQGRRAALAALHNVGRLSEADFRHAVKPLQRKLARHAMLGRALATTSIPPSSLESLITPQTIVCRCEGIRRNVLDQAIADGNDAMDTLKAATRCGMGPCGGRVCGYAAAGLIARARSCGRDRVREATSRPPLRPVPLAALLGDFDYGDFPVPAPAPL